MSVRVAPSFFCPWIDKDAHHVDAQFIHNLDINCTSLLYTHNKIFTISFADLKYLHILDNITPFFVRVSGQSQRWQLVNHVDVIGQWCNFTFGSLFLVYLDGIQTWIRSNPPTLVSLDPINLWVVILHNIYEIGCIHLQN